MASWEKNFLTNKNEIKLSTKQWDMAIPINEICENTKLARETALTGNYESSVVYYTGVVQQITRLLMTITDPNRKAKWQQVQQQIIQELQTVQETTKTLQTFKVNMNVDKVIGQYLVKKVKNKNLTNLFYK